MTDYFSLLDEPRRPWLDADLLKHKFLALSANLHPDKIHSADDSQKSAAAKKFAELNAAYHCLAEPKSRLLHLLELELGVKPKDIQQIPPALADWLAEVATVCKNTDLFLAEKSEITSPLLRVQFFERAQTCLEALSSLQKKLGNLRDNLSNELKSLDAIWMTTHSSERVNLSPRLEELYRLFSYFNRWNNQIQERVVQLTL